MNHFMIRFLLCNLLISGIIGVLLLGKRLLKNSLSSRMQYNLWFLLLGLLAVPFVPVQKLHFAIQKTASAPIKPCRSSNRCDPACWCRWLDQRDRRHCQQ